MLEELGYEEPAQAGRDDERRLAAYFVADRPLSGSELREFLAEELPDFMMPAYFVALEQMPLTRNGKIDRAALPDAQLGRPDLATAYLPPTSPVETRLAEIWSAALNVSQVGVRDNFFELGGSSLPAIQIVYQVGQAFQIDLPLQRFFEEPTVAGMADLVEELIIAEIENMSDAEAEQLLSRL